jgi:hypothetical protein
MADWQVVRTVGTEEEAALIAGFLEEAGIEAEIESLLFHQEPVTFGRLGEVRVLVDAGSLAAAEQALAAGEERAAEAALDAAEKDTALEETEASAPPTGEIETSDE